AQWKKANKRMYAGSYPAGIMLNFRLLFCRAVLELSGKKQTRGWRRDRNPTEVVLRVLFLFYQAVLRENLALSKNNLTILAILIKES
ncbi:hypothetical protein NR224_09455, partial [Pediococcus ethanolidurans]|uniref:hypothetical protein n=1 Tax=Pediococcus ethanolidurans TaxID=319653 RepID=UPI0021E79AA9